MLYFKINGLTKFYYGVRYGNIKLGLSPVNDLFNKYFTSSTSVHNLLKKNILPFKIVIHKTFNTTKEACEYEVKFLTKINAKERKDFLNQTNNFDNSLPNNKGRILSDSAKKAISLGSTKVQSNLEYREKRSILAKSKWANPEFRKKMEEHNAKYLDSGKSKIAGEKSGISRIGLKYNDEVKNKRSIAVKKACESIDMSSRAMNRKRFICPMCNLSNLDGGNFNRHMFFKHKWDRDQCTEFKSNL